MWEDDVRAVDLRYAETLQRKQDTQDSIFSLPEFQCLSPTEFIRKIYMNPCDLFKIIH